jgi:hypothetical protein
MARGPRRYYFAWSVGLTALANVDFIGIGFDKSLLLSDISELQLVLVVKIYSQVW